MKPLSTRVGPYQILVINKQCFQRLKYQSVYTSWVYFEEHFLDNKYLLSPSCNDTLLYREIGQLSNIKAHQTLFSLIQECFADIFYNDRGDIRHKLGCREKQVKLDKNILVVICLFTYFFTCFHWFSFLENIYVN